MKKSKIIAIVILAAMFAGSFAVANVTTSTISMGSSPVIESTSYAPDVYVGTPLGDQGIWIDEVTGITVDGDISDWATYHSIFVDGINVSIGYDATYVYVACQWFDIAPSTDLFYWEKWMNYEGYAYFDQYRGYDDMLTVGFSDASGKDLWTWTASDIRTDQAHAYEHDGANHADTGDKPFVLNSNGTCPLYDNTQTPLTDQDLFDMASETQIVGWFAQTPTGSQTDVDLVVDWVNMTTYGVYTAEFVRALDTTQADDVVLDFSDLTGQYFYVGYANRDNSYDMNIGVAALALCQDNDEAGTIDFVTIENNVITESLVIKGTVYDDYYDYYYGAEIRCFSTAWGGGHDAWEYADVNWATGNWSYLFKYNSDDLPLGVQDVYIQFCPKYEDTIVMYQGIDVYDLIAPNILGVVDLGLRYPDGLENDTHWVEITCGLSDNYNYNDDLVARLYIKKDDGVYTVHDLEQYVAGGTTFNVNITLTFTPGALNNYTYYIQAIDTSYNRRDSAKYWFLYTEYKTAPGFGIAAAILGLLGASFILLKKYKK